MQTIIKHLNRLGRNKRGISNVIVIVLSLVILVIISSNVVLWSYQMNQLDWERMAENLKITDVTRINSSSWFTTQSEYTVSNGDIVEGNYTATKTVDDAYQTFQESNETVFGMNGNFTVNILEYPLDDVKGVEIQLRYRASDSDEKWFLESYNWSSENYSSVGFNSTEGHTPTTAWDYYAVNITDGWRSYVQPDGTINIKFRDEGPDGNQTTIDIDFLAIRVLIHGAHFSFKSEGALTCHIVSIWIINSTTHTRYAVAIYVATGELLHYTCTYIALPADSSYIVKATTERGNTAVYSPS